ncbi:MAG: ribonuclease III [Hyphomicrobiales bacterium]|nr:ribonuclease III [Hyphomicrobiales bacterium]
MAKARRAANGLEASLGYRFKDGTLLERALTHSSARTGKAGTSDNERLEFLGDRVLGLVVAEMLIEAFPEASEGELARRFNHLVRGETCAAVARALGLGAFLVLSGSEAESGGRDKETILADACEAVLAAVFLEAGYAKVRDLVRRHWWPRLETAPSGAADAKSTLQEWAQGRGLDLPSYRAVERAGPDHAPMFVVEVKIGSRHTARGSGMSKRAAEQDAATTLLVREGVWNMPVKT